MKKQVHDNMPAGMFLGKEAAKEQKVLAARALQRELGLEGIFAVNKLSNWSSFDMVLKARNTLQRVFRAADPEMHLKYGKIKIGHGGTLDTLATGVLVVGVGCGTKLIDHFIAGKKVYEGVVRLGFQTTTGDLRESSLVTSRSGAT
jgi:tRNA pseudouridine55 synthase